MSSINSGSSMYNSKACSGNYSQCNEPNGATVCTVLPDGPSVQL